MPDIPHSIKPKGERSKRSRFVPPSIASLRLQGVTGVRVFCSSFNCGHNAVLPFDKLGKPETTLFPSLKFVCSRCGRRDVSIMPDWPKPACAYSDTWGGAKGSK